MPRLSFCQGQPDKLRDFPSKSMDLETLPDDQQANIRSPLVLAVDDNEDNLILLMHVLQLLQYSLITASNGETAVLMAQDHQPDLILLDIMLPDISGIEVVNRLKQNPLTRTIPVVAVTALARTQDRDRILLAGCNEYISKPYIIEELEALIDRYLGRKNSLS